LIYINWYIYIIIGNHQLNTTPTNNNTTIQNNTSTATTTATPTHMNIKDVAAQDLENISKYIYCDFVSVQDEGDIIISIYILYILYIMLCKYRYYYKYIYTIYIIYIMLCKYSYYYIYYLSEYNLLSKWIYYQLFDY
jgi:hypothetical protein